MIAFKCPSCGEISRIDPQTWFDQEAWMTLEDDDERIMCEHCLAVFDSRLSVEAFFVPESCQQEQRQLFT